MMAHDRAKIRQAICCSCGEIRTCFRPRNHQRENYWLRRPVDTNWHRETGDLKCANCNGITRHAILHPEGDSFRDHAERITHMALGGDDRCNVYDGDRIRKAYRQGRQPNPYLNHLWSTTDAEAAREAGRNTVLTLCGEVEKLPEKSSTCGGGGLLRPDPVRWEQEYEDSDTGSWWREMDCPDCYRVENERRLAARRKRLKVWLAWLLHDMTRVPDTHVDALIAACEAAAVEGGASE